MDTNDFMTRGRVSSQTVPSAAPSTGRKHHGPRGLMKLIMAGMIVSVAILVAAVIAFVVFGGGKSEDEFIKTNQYQAVFFGDQSGQVYFGKLSVVNSKLYRLTEVFNVQVSQTKTDTGSDSKSINLTKLDTLLYGPEDEMIIQRDQVLFWENLDAEGKAAKAIAEYTTTGATDTTEETTNQ